MKNHLFLILFVGITLMMTACAGEDNNTDSDAADNDEATAENGNLTVDLASAPVSLDPHAANDGNSLYVMNAMYDTLVQMNKDLQIEPGLAESLEQIEDTVWEAKIRQGVTFHDGSPLNAEVVKANLDRVRDSDVASPVSFLFDMISSVEVIDEYTVHIKTEFPFSALPSHLAHPGGHMISLESIKEDYEAMENGEEPFTTVNQEPVGTGYFKFDERVNGEYVRLVKNEDYWGEQANVDSITFKTVPESSARIAELRTGEADIIYPVNPNDVSEIDENEGTHVHKSESASMSYLGMNNEKEPFNNVQVRRAISMAINKDELIEGMLNGIPIPAKGPLAPTVKGYSEDIDPIDYNPEKARELLKEAGYEDGFQTSILVHDDTTSDVAELIQSQLSEVGIDAAINTREVGSYLEVTGNGSFDMFVGSWGTVTMDADYGLYPMFHSSNAGDSGNRSFFDNEKVDNLLEQARRSTNEEERMELYKEAQQIIVDEATIVPLYHSVLLAGLQDSVNGFFQYPSSFPFLRDVAIE